MDFVIHETYIEERAPFKLGDVYAVPIQVETENFEEDIEIEERGIINEHVVDEFVTSDTEEENPKTLSSNSEDEYEVAFADFL